MFKGLRDAQDGEWKNGREATKIIRVVVVVVVVVKCLHCLKAKNDVRMNHAACVIRDAF
jgi:hypothetical protein